jgi:hypothetical protein
VPRTSQKRVKRAYGGIVVRMRQKDTFGRHDAHLLAWYTCILRTLLRVVNTAALATASAVIDARVTALDSRTYAIKTALMQLFVRLRTVC